VMLINVDVWLQERSADRCYAFHRDICSKSECSVTRQRKLETKITFNYCKRIFILPCHKILRERLVEADVRESWDVQVHYLVETLAVHDGYVLLFVGRFGVQ
jgi:hypothetical protein